MLTLQAHERTGGAAGALSASALLPAMRCALSAAACHLLRASAAGAAEVEALRERSLHEHMRTQFASGKWPKEAP